MNKLYVMIVLVAIKQVTHQYKLSIFRVHRYRQQASETDKQCDFPFAGCSENNNKEKHAQCVINEVYYLKKKSRPMHTLNTVQNC